MNKGWKIGIVIGSVVIFVLLVGTLISFVFTGHRYDGWGMMGPAMMGGFGLGWFMPVLAIVFWGLVIWGIVTLIRFATSSAGSTAAIRSTSAIEILKERYARGEISKEEFEERKKDLI
jgi:putative membrane protein